MQIIKPHFIIEDKINGQKILKNLERYGRTCYKSEAKITRHSARNFIRRILKMGHESIIEHEKVTVRVICDRGVCYSKDTKILTKDGWKYFPELEKRDEVLSCNGRGRAFYIKPLKLIKLFYKGKLLNFKSSQIDLLVTPNHNMWVFDHEKRSFRNKKWKFIQADQMKNCRYKFLKGFIWQRKNSQYMTIKGCKVKRGFYNKYMPLIKVPAKPFLKFLGVFLTDGSCSPPSKTSGHRIQIIQSKKKYVQAIDDILKQLPFYYSKRDYKPGMLEFRISDKRLFNFLVSNFYSKNSYKKSRTLKLPQWLKMLAPSLLGDFLKGVKIGDGSKNTYGNECIYTGSLNFAQDLVEIITKVGLTANIRSVVRNQVRILNGKKFLDNKTGYIVNIVKTTEHLFDKRSAKITKLNYNGYVYSVALPRFHRVFVMRNGRAVWSGNSHEIVRHRLASYSQESTRYCDYAKKGHIQVIEPFFFKKDKKKYQVWKKAIKETEAAYNQLRKLGASPQEARSVLPNSLKTEIVITYNIREWRHFFKLRCSPAAHPQMREVTVPLLKEFQKRIPVLFDDFVIAKDSQSAQFIQGHTRQQKSVPIGG